MDLQYNKIVIIKKIGNENLQAISDTIEEIRTIGRICDVEVFGGSLDSTLPLSVRNMSNTLFISLGGDGTLLHTSRLSLKCINSGIVGLNFGTLGFLTEDVDRFTFTQNLRAFLIAVLYGDTTLVKPDQRMALDVQIGLEQFYAINEVTLFASLHYFLSTTVAVNGMPVGRYGGNGVAVTTATGSTALGLSAGGAIISPNTNVMQIVPILSHRVATQPVITSGRDVITLRAELTERVNEVFVLTDSQQVLNKKYGIGDDNYIDVVVRRAEKNITLWRPKDWNFFYVLSQKMGWS